MNSSEDLNNLNMIKMFTKIMQKMDKAGKKRKEEYKILINEISSIRREMQTALTVQERKMKDKLDKKIAEAESRMTAKSQNWKTEWKNGEKRKAKRHKMNCTENYRIWNGN